MCWTTNKLPKRQIADEDINVKKILFLLYMDDDKMEYDVISPYYGMQKWHSGRCVESELENPKQSMGCYHLINIGLHSCKEVVVMKGAFFATNEGKTWNRLWPVIESQFVCDAIIPKGSCYYVNEYGEYVSDRLICNFEITNEIRNYETRRTTSQIQAEPTNILQGGE